MKNILLLFIAFLFVTKASRKGKRLFNNDALPSAFKLVESHIMPSGVIMTNYQRAGKVQTGTVSA